MGTGGGFPGIPLAIAMPQCRFHLIDRIGKKIKVATEIASALGLKNVTFQHGDIAECKDKYHFVVSRAVMPLDSLIPLVRKNILHEKHPDVTYGMPNGLVCLKGGSCRGTSCICENRVGTSDRQHYKLFSGRSFL